MINARRVRIAFWSTLLVLLSAGQAFATSSLECSGIGTDAGVSILFGAGPMLNAIEADVFIDQRGISTRQYQDVERAAIMQFSADQNQLRLELMDDQADKHLATVHIVRQIDGANEPVQVGILNIIGVQPVSIVCDE